VTHDQTEAMTMGDRVAVIKQGRLQQVDSPQALYDHPANLFVGGFIGSPAMNMVMAELTRSDGRWSVSFGGIRLGLDESSVAARPGLAAFEGRSLVVGIRPEDIVDAELASDPPADRRFTADVDLREALGSEVLIHFSVATPPVLTEDTKELARDAGAAEIEDRAEARESNFVARLDPRTSAAERRAIELAVDTARLHFFDAETGLGVYD
jgi:multiple sugar transport system ATP-binding protein